MHFLTGDNGQRYEVRYKDGGGNEKVAGWTNTPETLTGMIDLHPVFHSPRVIDREGKDYDEGNKC